MVVLRRLTALVTMLVTLVLVLAESGFACLADGSPGMSGMHAVGVSVANAPRAQSDMAGMAMPVAAAPHGRAPAGADHHGGTAPDRAPCRFPWAPGGCRDMAPCAPAAIVVAALFPAPRAPLPDAHVASRVTAPPSVDTRPEPPPPRA